MSKDINPKLKTKLNRCIITSTRNLEKKDINDSIAYVECTFLLNYIDSHCKEAETKDFYALLKQSKKPFPNKELISKLPKKYQSDIITQQESLIKTFKSEKFKEVLRDIKI
jgi:hypothetical protein